MPAPRPISEGTCFDGLGGDWVVAMNELICAATVALGSLSADDCSQLDSNGADVVTVDDLVRALGNALAGGSDSLLLSARSRSFLAAVGAARSKKFTKGRSSRSYH